MKRFEDTCIGCEFHCADSIHLFLYFPAQIYEFHVVHSLVRFEKNNSVIFSSSERSRGFGQVKRLLHSKVNQ